MTGYNIIWNNFCDTVELSVKKKNSEKVFEKGIAKSFFNYLGWNELARSLVEQYSIKFATVIHKADFALFIEGKESPEIIVELKRPSKKKEEKDTSQLIDYMKQVKCSYGILLLGDKLEVYYVNYSTPEHEASPVETIRYKHNNEAALQLMEVLNRTEYTASKMLDYCDKRVKISKTLEYWCSDNGKTEIMDIILERSKLSAPLRDMLRTSLVLDVKRKDGTAITPSFKIDNALLPQTNIVKSRPAKVWMIPAKRDFFDHKACFDELGYIDWKQHNKMQVDDTGYIYLSQPDAVVKYRFKIIACDLPYSKEMDAMFKFYSNPEAIQKAKEHNRFYRIVLTGESTSGKLTAANMMKNGLTRPPQGSIELSHPGFKKLYEFIEKNF